MATGNFTTPKLSDGHHNFEAQATDVAGNNSQPSALVSIDVDTHIDAPVITAVTDNWWGGVENGGNILGVNDGFTNDTTPTFKGTAEAGSTIVLKNGNDIIAEKVVVDADGNWEFTPKSPLAEGEYNVVAIATDKAGNVSNPSNVATVNVDISTTQPVITEIIDDVAGGVVGNVKNALTNDNLPTLKGTAEAFSTVKIMVDDKLVFKDGKEVTVTADKDGNWEYTFEANLNWDGKVHAALEDGVHTLKVQTTDRAGNRSAVSEWSSVDVDTTIGTPTVKITTDINSDKKIDIADASALKDGKLKWIIDIPENTVKAGDRVQILGSDAKTWTDIFKVTAQDIAKGFIERDEFSIDMPKSRGFQTPSYRLVDDAGNVSEGSMDAVKIVGFAPKAPVIKAVLDNEYGSDLIDPIYGTTGNVLVADKALTNDSTPAFMGEAEVGTTITLKKGNTIIAENIPVGSNGKWFYEPEENSPWADGSYEITAIARNVFGKVSEPSKLITVTVDTTEPYLTIDEINDDVKTSDIDFTGNVKGKVTNDATPTLKGTAEPESLIVIKSGNEVYAEVHAGKNGSWEYKITTPLSDGLHIFSVQAHDKAGNIGSEIVANVTVDTKIADAKVEFIEDTNNDGKFSWKENIENPNIGRMAWKALIPDDGSIKAGDTFNYRWGASDSWHNRTITQADIDRGYIGEKVQNQYEQGQPNAGKPLAFGANANGRVYEAEAYFSDAAGNKGAKGSDKVVFDFSDNTDNKHIATTNVKITSIYDDVRGGHVGNLITNEAAQVAGLTNDKTPTISGTAEANASVKVSVVDSKSHSVWEKTITAESDGSWKVTTDNIADGNYSVTAVATNKAGAVSNPYTVSNLEIDTTIAQPNIWIKEDANQDKIYDKADYENPANGNGDITFVVDIPQDRVTIKAGDVFHYMINTNNPKWGNINGYTEDITITEADIKSGSISRVVTLCDDGKDFNMSHNGMIVSMNGYFKDLAGNALSNDTMVRFDLKNTYGGKVRSTRSLPDDILDNDSVDLSNATRINEPKAELNVLNNNKIGVSANDLLETPKDHIMNEGKSEAKPSYATASSHAGEENIATTHPIQIEEKVESHF
ncbi:Ig-like domain-containing protein [Campylobacter concisus]